MLAKGIEMRLFGKSMWKISHQGGSNDLRDQNYTDENWF